VSSEIITNNKGGMHAVDQYMSSYSFIRKSKKLWPAPPLFEGRYFAFVYSFILYNMSTVANQRKKVTCKKQK